MPAVSRTVLLARHATTDHVGRILCGRHPVALSTAGEGEAARLAAHLARRSIVAIHSSPQARAVQTAEAIARETRAPIEIVHALDEVDFGSWSGRRFDELANDRGWDEWNRLRGTATPPGGETMAAATARAVEHVAALPRDGTVLCVSHCDIIRGIVARYLGLSLDNVLRFDCDPASLTTLETWPDGGRVVRLNEVCA